MNNRSAVSHSADVLLAFFFFLPISFVCADDKPLTEPVELFIKFKADGTVAGFDPVTGETSYLISAVGYLPKVQADGVVSKTPKHRKPIVHLEEALITFEFFDFAAPPDMVHFSCDGCRMTFDDGSVLESDPTVPLDGRALFIYGPVDPDPENPAAQTVRMMGCAGLRETAGQSKLAGMVGSICFNGVFDFDVSNPPFSLESITGASNCTLTLHTPVPSE